MRVRINPGFVIFTPSQIAPGTPIELLGGPGGGTALYLRHINMTTFEVLTLPLPWGHGLLLGWYWVAFKLRRLERRFLRWWT